jgi:hypothetical protein
MRALHKANICNGDPENPFNVAVSAVSGGSLPAVLWDHFLRCHLDDQDMFPNWPEEALLALVTKAPHFAGQFNWTLRRLTGRSGWRPYLEHWWSAATRSLGKPILASLGHTVFLVQVLDFVMGEVWVFQGESICRPSLEFFKTGTDFGMRKGVSVPHALSAAMAFPVVFPPWRVPLDQHTAEFMDSGLIDNVAMQGMMPLILMAGAQRDKRHAWFLSPAC